MTRGLIWNATVAGILFSVWAGTAQEPVVYQPQGLEGQFLLAPVAQGGPLFQTIPPGVSTSISGTVGGEVVPNIGTILVGFDFLTPMWSFRDFTLAVPPTIATSFPLLGDTGHVDNHFAFVPTIKYNYHVSDPNFNVSASGTFLSLDGKLNRGIGSNLTGLGQLTATSQLTIVVANVAEVTKEFIYGDVVSHPLCFECLRDLSIEVGLGTRYASTSQNYSGSLTSSTGSSIVPGTSTASVSTRYSTQSFQGIGLTSSTNFLLPLCDHWAMFTNLRGSVLLGNNHKDSTLSVNTGTVVNVSATINQDRSDLIPVGELEMGFEWRHLLDAKPGTAAPPPLLTVRTAAVGQFWGNVGPLSAGSTQAYRSSDLFLVGVSVLAGVQY